MLDSINLLKQRDFRKICGLGLQPLPPGLGRSLQARFQRPLVPLVPPTAAPKRGLPDVPPPKFGTPSTNLLPTRRIGRSRNGIPEANFTYLDGRAPTLIQSLTVDNHDSFWQPTGRFGNGASDDQIIAAIGFLLCSLGTAAF